MNKPKRSFNMSTEKENIQPEIGLNEIITFLKKYGIRITLFGVLTIVAALCVIAAAYFLLPRKSNYISTIFLQLQKNKNTMVYPSEKPFSANDIISTPVLREVYNNHKLNGKIKFEDFCALFSLSGIDIEKALLAAQFKDKLSSKKLSVVELKNLEEAYANALQQLESGSVNIAMTPTLRFTEHDTVQILNEIPKVWFDIYSKQEAKIFPQIDTVAQVQSLRKNVAIDGRITTLNKAKNICTKLQNACKELDEILNGRKVSLPSGEFLSDLQERLTVLNTLRIQPMFLIVKDFTGSQHSYETLSLKANLMEIEKNIKMEKTKYAATLAAINILHPAENIREMKNAGTSGDKQTAMNVTLDNSFFSSLEVLIRKSNSIHRREQYADNALKIQEKLAELEAEKEHCLNLLAIQNKNDAVRLLTKEQFNALENVMFTELIDLCKKVNDFRDLIFKDHVQNRSFFTTTGSVLKLSSFYIPFKRIAAGLICLVLLLNVICAGKLFYTALSSGELKK